MIQRRFFDKGVDPANKSQWKKWLFSLNQMLDDLAIRGNPTHGLATLIGGTVTVNCATVTAGSMIFLSVNGAGVLANLGTIYEDQPTRVPGASFVIKSTNAISTAVVAWQIMEP